MHRKPTRRSTEPVFTEPQRLHKVLAQCGYGSLRGLEEMIIAGRITVNRMPAEVGQKVGPNDQIRINGELVRLRFAPPRARVLLYHKPAGEIVSRSDPECRPTVFDKLPRLGSARWIAVGRLDFNSEGLLLFTTSGELANRLMHPRYEVEREYSVRIIGRLTSEQERALVEGVQLEDGVARVKTVADGGGDEDSANHWYTVVLPEGRKREVRRLFEALGLTVSRLIRTRYGIVAMPPQLKRGQVQELEGGDLDRLLQAAGMKHKNGPEHRGQPRRDDQRHSAGSHPNAPTRGGEEEGGGSYGTPLPQEMGDDERDDAQPPMSDADEEGIDDVDGNRMPSPSPAAPAHGGQRRRRSGRRGRGNRGGPQGNWRF